METIIFAKTIKDYRKRNGGINMTREEEAIKEAEEISKNMWDFIDDDYVIPFKHGAEWADKTMFDKIVKWIDKNAFEYVKTESLGLDVIYRGFDTERMIADLKKAMKE